MAYTQNGATASPTTADYMFSAGATNGVTSESVVDAAYTEDTGVADAAYLDAEDDNAGTWGDESGSARYVLSTELVRQTYNPLDAHFSLTPIPVTAHVLPNAGEAAMQSADVYEPVFVQMASQYPQRVARLRDLYFRVKTARQTRIELAERDEAIRVAYNDRNNSNNKRIADELDGLRKEWAERRQACETDLAATRKTLVERETELLKQAEEAERDLWNLREKLAEEWDAQITAERDAQTKRDAERDAEAARIAGLRNESEIALAERERDAALARTEARHKRRIEERERVLTQQAAQEQALSEAYVALYEARLAVAE